MARSFWNHFTSAKVAGIVSNWKGLLSLTAPAGGGLWLPRPIISFDATASTAPTNRVRVVVGNTGQTGTARNPIAAHSANAAGASGGTGLENLTNMGSGGTVIWEDEIKGFGAQVLQCLHGMILAPSVTIQIDFWCGGACNAHGGWGGFEH